MHHEPGTQGLNDQMVQVKVFIIEHVADAQHLFDLGNARISRGNGLLLFIHDIVVFGEGLDDTGQRIVEVRRFFTRAGNDQRRTGFIDEDGVHFIDDTVIQRALYHLFFTDDHVITEIIKAKFIIGTIGNI